MWCIRLRGYEIRGCAEREQTYISGTRCDKNNNCKGGIDDLICKDISGASFACPTTGKLISVKMQCDRVCNCENCDDEWVCNGYKYSYTCQNTTIEIEPLSVCDSTEDCPHGDDEEACNEPLTCETEFRNEMLTLTNYTRCTPWILCSNKIDQTNCSDRSLAPPECLVKGKMSTISQKIIRKTRLTTEYNRIHVNSSGVCDDHIDTICVTPTSSCYVHKHQLCNNIYDCLDKSDESGFICMSLTERTCYRKYQFYQPLQLPNAWIFDGVEDCIDGID